MSWSCWKNGRHVPTTSGVQSEMLIYTMRFRRKWHKYTAEEIHCKVKNMTKKYREEKTKIGPSGGSPSPWKHYNAVNRIVGCTAVNSALYIETYSYSENSTLNQLLPPSDPSLSPPLPSPSCPLPPSLPSPSPSCPLPPSFTIFNEMNMDTDEDKIFDNLTTVICENISNMSATAWSSEDVFNLKEIMEKHLYKNCIQKKHVCIV
ncbi:uncharacterized protein LOC125777904 [Bactrocera dorsalis]|uniref:Uncharacterized protein LOC125777904 n=1 Tax=Bactrocera dorsalis TaxID=27457 RepID=A0ABM3JLC1_BACDO|nr:uncharacterized protein LOC125777904 [Bactrocera dorsalis]